MLIQHVFPAARSKQPPEQGYFELLDSWGASVRRAQTRSIYSSSVAGLETDLVDLVVSEDS